MGKLKDIYTLPAMIRDVAAVMLRELRYLYHDEGVIIFFVLVPLLYPILYSWVYSSQVVREVPVAVVDMSHSAESRAFIRAYDATPEARVASYAGSIDEARRIVGRQEARGIIVIPSDFSRCINEGRQTTVSLYTDMSVMLYYKALYMPATAVSQAMNAKLQVARAGGTTARDAELTVAPLRVKDVPMFIPTSGYGDFIIPGVMILVVHQTLLLGIGLMAGTAREHLKPLMPHKYNIVSTVVGKAMLYLAIYLVMSMMTLVVIPRAFGYVQLLELRPLFTMLVPFLLATIFFAMAVACVVRHREDVILLVVFTSVPLLFLSGVSWPQPNMPAFWQGVASFVPSTYGIRAFVRLNSMGATFNDILPEYIRLWVQTFIYFLITCAVYRGLPRKFMARLRGDKE